MARSPKSSIAIHTETSSARPVAREPWIKALTKPSRPSTGLQQAARFRARDDPMGYRLPRLSALAEVVPKDVVDGGDAVTPRDLLARSVVASVVGDGHLVKPEPQAGNLGCELGLEAESV